MGCSFTSCSGHFYRGQVDWLHQVSARDDPLDTVSAQPLRTGAFSGNSRRSPVYWRARPSGHLTRRRSHRAAEDDPSTFIIS